MSIGRSFAGALTRHCPNCGASGQFETWFRIRERCWRCGMRYERLPGFSLGVLTMNTIVTFGGMLLVIVIGMFTTYPDIAVVPIIVGCSLIAVVVPLVFHGSAATLWAALELVMRPLEPKELEDMARHRSDAGTAERSDGPAQRNEGGDTAEGPANGS